jgi:hypothetical protein
VVVHSLPIPSRVAATICRLVTSSLSGFPLFPRLQTIMKRDFDVCKCSPSSAAPRGCRDDGFRGVRVFRKKGAFADHHVAATYVVGEFRVSKGLPSD